MRWLIHRDFYRKSISHQGVQPIVHLVSTTDQTGVKVLPEALEYYKHFCYRSETLPKWDMTVVSS
jgi:hypothetical protein